MAQLSRPYQLGLLGIVLLAAVWLALFQGHSSSSSSGAGSSAPVVQTVTTSTTTASPKHASGATKIYKGAAPGVEGLTKAIAKAEGAVNTSKQNANTLEQKSAAASNEASTSSKSSSTSSSSSATHTASTPAKALASPTTVAKPTPTTTTTTAKPSSAKSSLPANQRTVETQLASGKIALILFWDPRGSDDTAVHKAVQQLNKSHLKIGVSYANASEVATFGSITRGIQVYGTPTLLIVNKKGQTTTLTGLEDDFAIEQAISEARQS